MKVSHYPAEFPQTWQRKIAGLHLGSFFLHVRIIEVDILRTRVLLVVEPVAGTGRRQVPIEMIETITAGYPAEELYTPDMLDKMR